MRMKNLPPSWFTFMLGLEGTTLVVEDGVRSFCGINERWNPKWPGWAWLDNGTPDVAFMQVWPFYAERWRAVKAEMLESTLALPYFDFAFNSGGRTACKELQRVLNVVFGAGLEYDGLMGPLTAAAAAKHHGPELEAHYAAARLDYLISLKRPEYIGGWLKRLGKVVSR